MIKIFSREEGSGSPIILIHGFCETSEIWSGFSSGLADANKIYSIDLPGFGLSPLPDFPITIDQIARMVIEWIEEHELINPLLVGHSLGGYVSLSIGEQAAEKISGLVLFHSTAYADSEEKKANRNKVIDFVKMHGVDPFVDTFVPGLFMNKNHPSIAYVDEIARKTNVETLICYSQAMRDRMPKIELLRSFKKPTLILGGQYDPIVPPEITLQLSELNDLSTSLLLPQTAHMGMFEMREGALKMIKGFASRLEV